MPIPVCCQRHSSTSPSNSNEQGAKALSNIAEKVFEAVKTLPEQQAAEVLNFAEALQAKRMEEYEQAKREALAMLDDPPLALGGCYAPRDSLYEH